MNQEIFKSARYFTLFDVIVSHSQLLLRSQKNNDCENNIDIIFFDTTYIQIFTRLNGISVRKIEDSIKVKNYNTIEKYLNNKNNHLFEVKSNGEKYYIAASFFKVFENQLNFDETSLNFDNKGREKEIATSIS